MDIYEELGLLPKKGRPTPRSDNRFVEWWLQKWRELRDSYKVFRITAAPSWWEIHIGLPRLDIQLDPGFDWTSVLIRWDILKFHFVLGLVDSD